MGMRFGSATLVPRRTEMTERGASTAAMPRRVLETTDHPVTIPVRRRQDRGPSSGQADGVLRASGHRRGPALHRYRTCGSSGTSVVQGRQRRSRGLNGQQGPKPVYESKLVLPDAGGLEIDGPLTGCELGDVQVLLGRPLLARSRLVYDGRTGKVVLEIDDEFDMDAWVAGSTRNNAGGERIDVRAGPWAVRAGRCARVRPAPAVAPGAESGGIETARARRYGRAPCGALSCWRSARPEIRSRQPEFQISSSR